MPPRLSRRSARPRSSRLQSLFGALTLGAISGAFSGAALILLLYVARTMFVRVIAIVLPRLSSTPWGNAFRT